MYTDISQSTIFFKIFMISTSIISTECSLKKKYDIYGFSCTNIYCGIQRRKSSF